MQYVNLAFYKFVELTDLETLRPALKEFCVQQGLKGTIILGKEGINTIIAGTREAIDALRDRLESDARFSNLPYKESLSDHQPFTRMLVKIKKEIVAFGIEVNPARNRAPTVKATELKQWLDEGREVILLDTRNDYEILTGKFNGAFEMGIRTFRAFPEKVKELLPEWKDKTIVSYCTGGIRCEKAAPYMRQIGFKDVYHLEGGILKYFEEVGGAHYDGECFVFDYRIGLNPKLEETATAHCPGCQFPVTAESQRDPRYIPGQCCPNCHQVP
ncbi:sulfurtransferase [bacterium]|nr:sulfurtransferase [bacterium]